MGSQESVASPASPERRNSRVCLTVSNFAPATRPTALRTSTEPQRRPRSGPRDEAAKAFERPGAAAFRGQARVPPADQFALLRGHGGVPGHAIGSRVALASVEEEHCRSTLPRLVYLRSDCGACRRARCHGWGHSVRRARPRRPRRCSTQGEKDNGPSAGAGRPSGSLRVGGTGDSNACRTVRLCTPWRGKRPDREALAVVIPADLLEQLHPGTHPLCRPPMRALTRARSADDRTEGGAKSSRCTGPTQAVVPSLGISACIQPEHRDQRWVGQRTRRQTSRMYVLTTPKHHWTTPLMPVPTTTLTAHGPCKEPAPP